MKSTMRNTDTDPCCCGIHMGGIGYVAGALYVRVWSEAMGMCDADPCFTEMIAGACACDEFHALHSTLIHAVVTC